MLRPSLQPSIHVDFLSTADLALPAIVLDVLLCGSSGIFITCPSHHILPAIVTGRKLDSHLMLEHTSKDSPEDAQTRSKCLHPPFAWFKTRVHSGPPGESMCDLSHISCGPQAFWILPDRQSHSMHDWPAQCVSRFFC